MSSAGFDGLLKSAISSRVFNFHPQGKSHSILKREHLEILNLSFSCSFMLEVMLLKKQFPCRGLIKFFFFRKNPALLFVALKKFSYERLNVSLERIVKLIHSSLRYPCFSYLL